MKDNGGCFLNTFLIFGLLALAFVVAYRVAFYASYLYLEKDEIIFDWTGGEQNVWVSTDANSWIIEDDEFVSWASLQKRDNSWYIEYDSMIMIPPTEGNSLHVQVYQNDNKEDRVCHVTVRSGYIRGLGRTQAGLGNKSTNLKVIQRGKQATYLNVSRQTISFSERGGTEKVQISTDGNGWSVVECPNWISASVSGPALTLRASKNNGKTSRKGVVNIQVDKISTMINVSQKSDGPEIFTDFWRLFSNDREFQKSRVKLPILLVSYDIVFDDEGDEISRKTTSYIEEWRYENMSEIKEEFEVEIQRDDDSYQVFFTHRKYDFSFLYIFNQYEGEWYLTQIHKSST